MADKPICQPEEAQASPTGTNGNEPQPPTNTSEITLREVSQSSSQESPKAEPINHLSIYRSTGPQTLQGKQRSKFNALKHGLLSKAILLEGESRAEYLSLVRGLWDDFQCQGKLEAVLAEHLAALLWRRRRLFQAENAEISENIASTKLDAPGLIWTIDKPDVLKRCNDLLNSIWKGLHARGFDKVQDGLALKTIYGNPDRPHLRKTLQDEYSTWHAIARMTDKERAHGNHPTPDECKLNVLRCIAAEIKRFEECSKKPQSIESERTNVEILRQSVPDSQGMDRLLRYEAHLSREFERTLSQLERLQRMRKGQPVLPPIKVEVSS